MNQHEWVILAAYVAGGLTLGLILQKLLLPLLKNIAAKTGFKSYDLILQTISKWILSWCVASAIYFALKAASIDPRYDLWIERAVLVFFIFSCTVIIATIASGFVKIKAAVEDANLPSTSIINNIIKVIIYCVGILVILQSLGISVTPILAGLGVGGLAVALALQNTLSNLFAGLQIVSSGSLNKGDFIKLSSSESGYIVDITWRSTSIKNMANNIIIIPNNKLADMVIQNFTLPNAITSFDLDVGIAYNSNLEFVEKIAKMVAVEVLDAAEGAVKDEVPTVRFIGFGNTGITMRISLTVSEYALQFKIRHLLLKTLYKRFLEEGIVIPIATQAITVEGLTEFKKEADSNKPLQN